MPHVNEPLPVDTIIPDILARLRDHSSLVITAPPGAGKTTRVPRALFESGFAGKQEIVILEPRRIAARLAAARVAEELGEPPGRTVGYTIRHDTVDSPQTRIRFVTEAVLIRKLIDNPHLTGISTVILDEFHERSLHTDMAAALLRRLIRTARRDLKIVVMSATLDCENVSRFFGGAPCLCSQGRLHRVSVEYESRRSDSPLHQKVVLAVRTVLEAGCEGEVLVFLPGASEIRHAVEALEPLAGRAGLMLVPLHGDLPFPEQLRAVQPATQRKVILATNVAESSITIPGVGVVIDSGLAREAGYAAWSGLPRLSLVKISRASAEQRAGRAGRTRPGHVIRLYTRHDFESRPDFDRPEIGRRDLAEPLLLLLGLGISGFDELQWLDAPPQASAASAGETLRVLGAADAHGGITAVGRELLRIPSHPRLARMILEGHRLGIGFEACLAAALISERPVRIEERAQLRRTRRAAPLQASAGESDLFELLERIARARDRGFTPAAALKLGLDFRALEAVDRVARHLARIAGIRGGPKPLAGEAEEPIRIATLTAFPDRVAKRRQRGSPDLLLASGGMARLSPASVVQDASMLVAVDIEERTGDRGSRQRETAIVRLASSIEAEWIAALFPDCLVQESELIWNERAGRVDEATRTHYRRLMIDERLRPAPPSEAASHMLCQAAFRRDLRDFADTEQFTALQSRLELIGRHYPDHAERISAALDRAAVVLTACSGRCSLGELREIALSEVLSAGLEARVRCLLERQTPERVVTPGGRRLKVHYESGKPPWIESRLQDFFGMSSAPRICDGRVGLTIRLLAPNLRPVQVTQDLAGFWVNHYPRIRKELRRRYPKHAWPEPGAENKARH